MSTGATAPATDPGTLTDDTTSLHQPDPQRRVQAGVSQPPVAAMAAAAQRIRRDIVEMTTAAGSGHPSSSLSAVEIMTALYFGGLLRHDAARPEWPERDRFILSKGHAAPILYAVLAERGYFGVDRLSSLRRLGSPLEGHPNMRRLPGVEASTGSLGQGLSIGLGHALAGRVDRRDYRVYVLLGDGEVQEGQVWEAAMAAAQYRVASLTAIVDHNKAQQTDLVERVLDYRPLTAKWEAFQWHVQEVDGHDQAAVWHALAAAREVAGRPQVIVAHTVKGKGIPWVERDFTYHGKALPTDEAERALALFAADGNEGA